MKFTAKEDIEAPIDAVFRAVSDFDAFERSALRRGAQVQRVSQKTYSETLIAWDVTFPFRGKKRKMLAELVEFDSPHRVLFKSMSSGIKGEAVLDLVALSRGRTRLSVVLDFKPKTLAARVMIQSLRIAKNRLNTRYRMRVASFASDIEDRFKTGRLA